MTLKAKDPQIYDLIQKERRRQAEVLELIASENYVSQEVLQALGSILTNKYAEGYPRKRYYAGNEVIDQIEELACERVKDVFDLPLDWHVNVQPYSGSPANMEAYAALLEPGDTIMAMDLSHGGHLTHGAKVNFSGKTYNFMAYGISEKKGDLDYMDILKMADRVKPKLIVCGFTAYPREIDFKKFRETADKAKAIAMADISHIAGLVAAGVHPSPVPLFDVVTTTTHKTLRGPRGAIIMCKDKYASAIDKAVFPGSQGGPHENAIAAIAVAMKEAKTAAFRKYAEQIVKNAKALARSLQDFATTFQAYFGDQFATDPAASAKFLTDARVREMLAELGERYATLDPFTEESAEQLLRSFAEEKAIKAGALINGARVLLTGQGVAPSLFAVMAYLGKHSVARRLLAAKTVFPA